MTRDSLGALTTDLAPAFARVGPRSFLRSRVSSALGTVPGVELLLSDAEGDVRIGPGMRDAIRVEVLDPRFYEWVVTRGAVGAAEAYVDGLVTTSDLVGLLRMFAAAPEHTDGLEQGLARVAGWVDRALHALRPNTRAGSRVNIAAHYDLGNPLFELFLDPTMMYSSAVYEDPSESLERAQTRKLDRIARSLALSPEDHLLEIGTGWGGMAIHAARRYGCRVTTTTISREQHAYAVERVAREGLGDRVEVLLRDYRDLEGRYDKLVSIEMVEAVGAGYLSSYFDVCASLLAPKGLALVQAITVEDHRYEQALRSVDFIKKHVFPGCFIPSASVLVSAAAAHGSLRLVGADDIGSSYALTLRAWRERFLANAERARSLGYDDRFVRLWEYYLAYCEAGYLEGRLGNLQLLLAKPGYTSPLRARSWASDP